jgi:hypothetical protein
MTTTYVTAVSEVRPDAQCKCGDAAELHAVINTDPLQPKSGDPEEPAVEYYAECTRQGCGCRGFEEAE